MQAQANASFEISELVTALQKGSAQFEPQLDEALDCLQSFECWSIYFRVLEQQIDNPKKRQIHHYVRTARAYSVYLEDIQKAARVCVKLMKDLKLGYLEFREKVPYNLIGELDFGNEAILLQAIYPRLKSKEDYVACMERLCLIYEKKKYDEGNLNRSYERLIELDPMNQKALRYFKIVYTQNNQWDKVAQVLQSLFTTAKHENEKYRSAQELAAVYLYQMDMPQQAVDVIEKHCADSPLSTFTIHYEAYYRLMDWEGCLQVLKGQFKKSEGNFNKAVLSLKIGEMQEKTRRYDEAEQAYREALRLESSMLEPLEKLIDLHLREGNWQAVLQSLKQLDEALDDLYLKEKVREGMARLQAALEDVAKGSSHAEL